MQTNSRDGSFTIPVYAAWQCGTYPLEHIPIAVKICPQCLLTPLDSVGCNHGCIYQLARRILCNTYLCRHIASDVSGKWLDFLELDYEDSSGVLLRG